MLSLKLYKNCILNETYQNVFSTGLIGSGSPTVYKTVLERYLDTLSSKNFNIDYVYQENRGTLVFEYDVDLGNIYEYNFIRIISLDDQLHETIRRYCFIGDIKIKNGLVYLDYNEDIWSSYSDKITGITESYLSNSRNLNYIKLLEGFIIPFYKLPVEYGSNNNVYENRITISSGSSFYMVMNIQYYQPAGQGVPVSRKLKSVLVASKVTTSYFKTALSKSDVESALLTIPGLQQITNAFVEGSNNYSFEIQDIYVIPTDLVSSLLGQSEIINRFTNNNYIGSSSTYFWADIKLPSSTYGFSYETLSQTISNDFKNISIGTLRHQYPILNNGSTWTLKLRVYMNSINEFRMIMDFQNKLIDITDDFRVEVPISYLSSEVVAQYAMARQLKNTQINNEINSANLNLHRGIQNTMAGNTAAALKAGSSNNTGSISNIGSMASTAVSNINNIMNIGYNAIESGFKLNTKLAEINYNNAKVHNTTSMTLVKDAPLITSYTGLYIQKIEPDNEIYVKKSINNLGYEVYYYVSNYSYLRIQEPEFYMTKSVPVHYNVIKFETCNVYGSFPRSVAIALNSILMSGVKIWFDYTMSEDNLVVG